MERALEIKILEEIARLSRDSRVPDAPASGIKLNLIIIDMLTAILLDKMTVERFVLLTMKIKFPIVGLYYQDFFKNELA